jgi:nitrate/TMAO reductase-like tetraheme cytochrome c subunit
MTSLLDFCRDKNIPFNETDKLLYKLQQSKDNYEIYRVLFDSLTNNNKPFEAAANMMNTTSPIKLPNGDFHIGWPSRLETP